MAWMFSWDCVSSASLSTDEISANLVQQNFGDDLKIVTDSVMQFEFNERAALQMRHQADSSSSRPPAARLGSNQFSSEASGGNSGHCSPSKARSFPRAR